MGKRFQRDTTYDNDFQYAANLAGYWIISAKHFNPFNPTHYMKMKASVYPDPFTDHLSLEVAVEFKESVIVCMLDRELAIVRMFSWPLQAGKNKVSFYDVASLPTGEYTVTITNPGGKNLFNSKVIKK